ncbi:hypothetical protein M422DRAFT_241601 [Sphaerobolus stellatus SS14]|nr:hypothetical protein M422DRAFT_241601 [Sphaerobolus stellatus SS14]
MNSANTTVQPKATSGMMLSVQPSIEQAEVEARQQKHGKMSTLRLRGGGAGKVRNT